MLSHELALDGGQYVFAAFHGTERPHDSYRGLERHACEASCLAGPTRPARQPRDRGRKKRSMVPVGYLCRQLPNPLVHVQISAIVFAKVPFVNRFPQRHAGGSGSTDVGYRSYIRFSVPVFRLEFPQPLKFGVACARVLRPLVDRRRATDPVFPHQIRKRDPRRAFLQDANDLPLREPGRPHGASLQSARKSNIPWSGSRGSVPVRFQPEQI